MNWNLRYAREMDEETLNRFIPTISGPINRLSPVDKFSSQLHRLDKTMGSLQGIATIVDSDGMTGPSPATAYQIEDISSPYKEPSEWEFHANEALGRHFNEEPIDLPNKVDLHHPDNHRHILHRVKKWVANQV